MERVENAQMRIYNLCWFMAYGLDYMKNKKSRIAWAEKKRASSYNSPPIDTSARLAGAGV